MLVWGRIRQHWQHTALARPRDSEQGTERVGARPPEGDQPPGVCGGGGMGWEGRLRRGGE